MLSVTAYPKCIPPGNKNPEKPKLLEYFIHGVQASGDKGILNNTFSWTESDVAILQGFVHPESKHVPHLNLRRDVLENQTKHRKRTIIADSNLFLYADPGNKKTYLRYSYDGIFPNTGEYCTGIVDKGRWQQLSKDLNISLKKWKKPQDGKYILITCQRDGGWSMGGTKIISWLHPLLLRLQRKGINAPVRVRFHPGDKKNHIHMDTLRRAGHKIQYSSPTSNILDDFKDAMCVISHNSSPGVAAAIEGVPLIVLDPDRSQARDVAFHSLDDFEKIPTFNRQDWIEKLAMSHWRLDELRDGKCWQHMKQWAELK